MNIQIEARTKPAQPEVASRTAEKLQSEGYATAIRHQYGNPSAHFVVAKKVIQIDYNGH